VEFFAGCIDAVAGLQGLLDDQPHAGQAGHAAAVHVRGVIPPPSHPAVLAMHGLVQEEVSHYSPCDRRAASMGPRIIKYLVYKHCQ
jgi:hypothetical protein